MSEERAPITDCVATAEGGFLNLQTGEVLSIDVMLSRYSRAEVESVPTGHRRQRPAGNRRSPASPDPAPDAA
jgi:hypothetical protein